jgi:hypothetical protein
MEIKETGIKHFTTFDEMFQALKGHFKALTLEKHPTAMIRLIQDNVYKKVFKNHHGAKLSKSIEAKYRDGMVSEFRRYYGEWINVYDLNIKKGIFKVNFETAFKTDLGRLYGSNPGSIHDHVFYTAHSFEQFRDRSDCYKALPLLVLAYKRIRNTDPTPADILKFLALNAFQYCQVKNSLYVNVNCGVLVFERLSGGILIGKTFLLPDMDFPKEGWYVSKASGMHLDTTDWAIEVCKEFGTKAINSPTFFKVDEDYSIYVKTMKEQINSTGLDV